MLILLMLLMLKESFPSFIQLFGNPVLMFVFVSRHHFDVKMTGNISTLFPRGQDAG